MTRFSTRYRQMLALGLAVLVAAPAAAAGGVLPGIVDDTGPLNDLSQAGQGTQPSCPDGTNLLVKFEYDEETQTFEPEGGDDMGMNVTIVERKTGEEDPIAVDWNSTEPISAIVVKNGTEETTYDVDGSTMGTIDVGDDGPQTKGISNIQFCVGPDETTTPETTTETTPETTTETTPETTTERTPETTTEPTPETTTEPTPETTTEPTPETTTERTPETTTETTTTETVEPETVYYQVDLVVGEPLQQVGPEGEAPFYGDQRRLVRGIHGSSEEKITINGDGGPRSISDEHAKCVTYEDVSVADGQMTVTFTIADGCTKTMSLASYEKPGAGFDRDMKQTLYDSETETFGPGTHTLTVDLPGRTGSSQAAVDQERASGVFTSNANGGISLVLATAMLAMGTVVATRRRN